MLRAATMPSVLLIDDDDTFLRHAKRYLAREPQVSVLDALTDSHEGVDKARALQPDVILLDLSMPGQNGFETLPLLKQVAPHARVIALTMLEADSYREMAFASGADGFIPKSRLVEDLIPEILRNTAD